MPTAMENVMSPRVLDTAAPLVTKSLLAAAAPLDAVGEIAAISPMVPAETAKEIGDKSAISGLIPGVGGYNRGQIQRRVGLDYEKKFNKTNSKYPHEIIGTYTNVLGIAAIGAVATALAAKKGTLSMKGVGEGALKAGVIGGFMQLGGALAAAGTPKLTNEQLYQQEQRPAWMNYAIPGLGAYRGYKRLGKGYADYTEKDKAENSINNHEPVSKEASLFDWFGRFAKKEQEPDYSLDDRPEDLSPGIYQGSRSVFQGKPVLQDIMPGEHGFLFLVPKDKRKFKDHLREMGGGVRGIIVSGYNEPMESGLKGLFERKLVASINKPRDVAGIKLLMSEHRDPSNRNPKLYNITGDIPDVDSKIDEIVNMTKTYQEQTKDKPYAYKPFPVPGKVSTEGANCLSWVNSVASLAKLKNRVKNYQGFDPGVSTKIPETLFKPSTPDVQPI